MIETLQPEPRPKCLSWRAFLRQPGIPPHTCVCMRNATHTDEHRCACDKEWR